MSGSFSASFAPTLGACAARLDSLPSPPVGCVPMNARTRPPTGLSASTHALTAAVPTGEPCLLFANISGICFSTASMASRFAASGTAMPAGSGEYGSSASGTTSMRGCAIPSWMW